MYIYICVCVCLESMAKTDWHKMPDASLRKRGLGNFTGEPRRHVLKSGSALMSILSINIFTVSTLNMFLVKPADADARNSVCGRNQQAFYMRGKRASA